MEYGKKKPLMFAVKNFFPLSLMESLVEYYFKMC